MRNQKIYIFLTAVSTVFLILISVTTIMLTYKTNTLTEEKVTETEYVYVYVEESDVPADTDIKSQNMIIKEYKDKIGIYSAEGILLQTIDTNINTLPIAEREALREGIEIKSIEELYSIIEAYTD